MASLRQKKPDANWFLDYRDVDGTRYRIDTGTTNEEVAKLWLRKTEDLTSQAKLGILESVGRIDADVVAGKKKKSKSQSLKAFKELYEDRSKHDIELSQSTIEINNCALDSFIGVVGNKKLDKFSDADVRRWKRALDAEGKAKTTISIYHKHLRAMFNRAIKWKLVEQNAFDVVEVTKARKRDRKEKDMEFEEVKLLLNTIDEADDYWFGIYVRFVLYTACRRNEILFLRHEDIDLQEMSLTVMADKTEKSLKLPINTALKRVIDEMELKKTGFVFQTRSKSNGAFRKDQPWHKDYVTHRFKRFVRLAGLPEHYTLHSLRHTYATQMRKKGVPLDIVQRLLGHASARTTEDNYDHSVALHFREQADLIDFEFGE